MAPRRRPTGEDPPDGPTAAELLAEYQANDTNNDGVVNEDDDLSPEQVQEMLAGIDDPDEQWTWLTENADRMSSAAFDDGQKFIADGAEAAGIDVDPEPNPVGAELADQQALDDAREDAIAQAAEIYGNTAPGVDPDLSDVEAMVPEGLDPNDRERWLTDVIAQGRTEAVESRADEIQGGTGTGEAEAQQIAEGSIASDDLFGATEPDWLLQMNGGNLSEQQKRRYVDYWNDAYGENFTDFDRDLAPILARYDGTEAEAQNFANSVLADQEPLITEGISLPLIGASRTANYTQEQMEDLRAMGYSNDAITRLVRLSAIRGGENAITQGPGGDTVDVRAFAALARYFGGGDEFGQFEQRQQDIAAIERELGLRPGQWGQMTAEERQLRRAELEQKQRSAQAARGDGEGTPFDADIERMDRIESLLRSQGTREDRGTSPGIFAARNNFDRGMEQYRGDELLALVYAVDPSLAERVASTGGDPEKLDWKDNSAVYDILEQGGVIDQTGVRLRQLESATGFFGFFETGGGRGGGGGGAGPVRRVVDPVAVKSQVQQLWSRMFLADVDDATVAAITANLQSQLDAAPDGMSFDATARIEAFLKGQDVYDELYRNKPEGLSEEEYQGQFAAGVGDMLGNELDPEALKSGMRTGDYNTAVGRAAASDKLLTNSTLRGRWAQAKQVMDQFT